MKKHFCTAVCAVALALTSAGTAFAAGLGKNIALRLVGTDTAYPAGDLFAAYGVADPEGTSCWDFVLEDIKTGKVIGEVSDCARVDNVFGGFPGIDPIEILSFEVTGTTFFHLPGGTVVTRIMTTVQPVIHGSLDHTHITGAIPQAGDNNVIYGDGRFARAEGTARLSGAGDFSRFLDFGELSADCIFVLDIGPDNR